MTQLIHSGTDCELWCKAAGVRLYVFKSEYVQIRLNPIQCPPAGNGTDR